MARLTHGPVTPRRSVSSPDSLTDLTRLLDRLQQNILHADAERERRLRASEHERNKAGINLEYARTLLTKLEQDALAIKVHARRQEMQADLNRKRAVFEQVAERLRELEDISIDSDEDDSDEGEDLLGDIIPTPSQSSESRSSGHLDDGPGYVREGESEDEREHEGDSTVSPRPTRTEPEPTSTAPSSQPSAPTITTSSTQPQSQSLPPEPQATGAGTTTSPSLRPRGSATATGTQQAATTTDTATSTGALRSQLLGPGTTPSPTTGTTTATAEAILDHHRAEQDKLTESMVSMAKALKASSHAFQSALREDQDVLAGAGKGLDRSERSLEGVAGRMGSLRRLTEGEGWWGRMLLYAWIAGLAVFAVLLVFVFPKLRF